jgi:hypothetical protein
MRKEALDATILQITTLTKPVDDIVMQEGDPPTAEATHAVLNKVLLSKLTKPSESLTVLVEELQAAVIIAGYPEPTWPGCMGTAATLSKKCSAYSCRWAALCFLQKENDGAKLQALKFVQDTHFHDIEQRKFIGEHIITQVESYIEAATLEAQRKRKAVPAKTDLGVEAADVPEMLEGDDKNEEENEEDAEDGGEAQPKRKRTRGRGQGQGGRGQGEGGRGKRPKRAGRGG